jgi:hypothetical protein
MAENDSAILLTLIAVVQIIRLLTIAALVSFETGWVESLLLLSSITSSLGGCVDRSDKPCDPESAGSATMICCADIRWEELIDCEVLDPVAIWISVCKADGNGSDDLKDSD